MNRNEIALAANTIYATAKSNLDAKKNTTTTNEQNADRGVNLFDDL